MSFYGGAGQAGGGYGGRGGGYGQQGRFQPYSAFGQQDGASGQRQVADYSSSVVRSLQWRIRSTAADAWDAPLVQPLRSSACEVLSPSSYDNLPAAACPTSFVYVGVAKRKGHVTAVAWTPDGRRLIAANENGEFTLWTGATFAHEATQTAHESAIYCLKWTHDASYLLSGDRAGTIWYHKSNMDGVRVIRGAHKEAVRGISFAPGDSKFASCSDDGTVKVWDLLRTESEEATLVGHGGDVKCCDWHPHKALIASGSKDTSAKLWDARARSAVATLHGHKAALSAVQWHRGGVWLLTGAKDTTCKVFDVRMLAELRSFTAHQRDVTCAQWHPHASGLFASGSADGSVAFWTVDSSTPVEEVAGAHNSTLALAWHPMGHVLCTGGADHTAKFWARPRPGEAPKLAQRWRAPGGGGGGGGGGGAGDVGGPSGAGAGGASGGGGGRVYGGRR